LSDFWLKIVGALGLIMAAITAFKVKESKDVQRGKDEVKAEANEQILEDIETKNEIEEHVNEVINNSSDDDRVDRLLGKRD